MQAIDIFKNNPSSHTVITETVNRAIINSKVLINADSLIINCFADFYRKVEVPDKLLYEYNNLYYLYYLKYLLNDTAITNIDNDSYIIQKIIRKLYFDFFKSKNFIKY